MQINEKLSFLLKEKSRYKIAYGGRAGGKSRDFSGSLLIIGAQEQCRIVACRDTEKSIIESIHQLFEGHILREPSLRYFYEIQQKKIIGKNGTEIMFAGLRNPDSFKSFEEANYVWIEEAQTINKHTWDILIPTVRAPFSEIWVSFNPDFDTDETYKRFITNRPNNSIVQLINYTDNPFCPQVIIDEAEELKAKDIDEYNHIYLGQCVQVLEGSVYAKEIRNLYTNGHITKVPYEPMRPVDTFWDLGRSDFTCIWFAQWVGMELHIIDFYHNRLENADHYAKVLSEKGYLYGTDYMPHDAKHKTMASKGSSLEEQFTQLGRKVKVLPPENKTTSINSVRTILPKCYFDEAKTQQGINFIKRYSYKIDPNTRQWSKEPVHDENSHAADALAILGIASKPVRERRAPTSYSTDIIL